MPFRPGNVPAGVGTIYAAPLGTTEPTSVTGAWPTGWIELGYTEQGSVFNTQLQTATLEVEEELMPLRYVATGRTASLAFALAEYNEQNLALSLNGGITSVVAGVETVAADGSLLIQPPTFGTEARVMLGWDYLPKGATSPVTGQTTFGRIILRQCLQTAAMALSHRKGNNLTVIACEFSVEVPATGLQPFEFIAPAALSTP